MYYRILQGTFTAAYFLLLWLTHLALNDRWGWGVALSSGLVGVGWLIVTRLQIHHCFKGYFDLTARLQIVIPAIAGFLLAAVAVQHAPDFKICSLGVVEAAAWVYILWLYRRNARENFIFRGGGPLPSTIWLTPDFSVLQPGDLLLTGGDMSANFQKVPVIRWLLKLTGGLEGLDHGEVVIRLKDGSLGFFSCYMPKGVVIHTMEWFKAKWRKLGRHYVVLRLVTPLTEEQICRMTEIAYQMYDENHAEADRINAFRARLVNGVPLLPRKAKDWLIKIWHCTGYDWWALLEGRLAKHVWTCIGACYELYNRLGIKLRKVGSGLFAIGSGWFDPIKPSVALYDPAFRPLDKNDEAAYLAQQATATSGT